LYVCTSGARGIQFGDVFTAGQRIQAKSMVSIALGLWSEVIVLVEIVIVCYIRNRLRQFCLHLHHSTSTSYGYGLHRKYRQQASGYCYALNRH